MADFTTASRPIAAFGSSYRGLLSGIEFVFLHNWPVRLQVRNIRSPLFLPFPAAVSDAY
ncbi:MAG: hypothetical protein JWQ69_123 [Pseudomonas sp.]|nr:hypothetical protein [Pseudomonas sp.]